MNKFKYIAIGSTLFLTACVTTPYQKAGFFSSTGGYEDKIISEGVYSIKSKVNANTSPKLALTYWHKRAEELCGHSEYVSELKQSHDLNINPGAVTTTHEWPIVIGIAFCDKRS